MKVENKKIAIISLSSDEVKEAIIFYLEQCDDHPISKDGATRYGRIPVGIDPSIELNTEGEAVVIIHD